MWLPVPRHVFGLEEFEQPVMPAFSTYARLFHPTEWRSRIGDEAAIQTDHPRLECFGDSHSLPDISREDIRDETMIDIVRTAQHFPLVRERHDWCHWPEDLFLEHRIVDRHAGKNGGLETERRHCHCFPTTQHLGAATNRTVNEFANSLLLGLRYERTEGCMWGETVAEDEGGHACDELRGEFKIGRAHV